MSAAAVSAQDVDPFDVRFAVRAPGLLRTFNQSGVLSAADVHVATRLGKLGREPSEEVQLAAALAVRAVRLGSVCIELATVASSVALDEEAAGLVPAPLGTLPWPEPDVWAVAVRRSPLVAEGLDDALAPLDEGRPLRFVDGLLYLDRYWRQEQLLRHELDTRAVRVRPAVDAERLRAALHRLWPGKGPDRQRLAAAVAALSWTTVLAGGPGTGKTTTVARLLAVLADQPGEPVRIALAAPTGKAAARLQEAVRTEAARLSEEDRHRLDELTASTVHRLLGWRPDRRGRFRHDRTNRLPYDVVVVDETSMVSLTLMSRLLEAVRPEARLVLVGDPDQLASVEAGAVLGDLVARPPDPAAADLAEAAAAPLTAVAGDDLEPDEAASQVLASGIVRLTRTHRYGGTIGELAEAVRAGEPDRVVELLRSGAPSLEFVETESLDARVPGGVAELRSNVVEAGRALVDAARRGDAEAALRALDRHRLLCAHRQGPFGVSRWSDEVERWLTASIDGFAADGEWYRGRPLLATTNDYDLRLFNGDTGVVIDAEERGTLAVFGRGDATPLQLVPSRLSGVQTVHAMTVHRSQGSQFSRVSLLLPQEDSPLLTRELFYTAVTRATDVVRVLGTEAAVRAAVQRPILRASGLRRRFR